MSALYDDLKQSLEEAAAYLRGENVDVIVHHPVEPRAIREKSGLTQEQMARMLDMSLSGYRKWEQGQRSVSGPARVLLRVLDKHPEAVLDVVG